MQYNFTDCTCSTSEKKKKLRKDANEIRFVSPKLPYFIYSLQPLFAQRKHVQNQCSVQRNPTGKWGKICKLELNINACELTQMLSKLTTFSEPTPTYPNAIGKI